MLTQCQLLNKILATGDISIITNNGITSDYFTSLKNEFNYIYNHYKQYSQVPDLATFLNVFENFEVLEVNESTDYLVNELRREKDESFLASTFNQIRSLLMDGKTDEAMDLFTTSSSKVGVNKHLDAVDILDDISRYDDYVDKCNDFMKYYISTGFKELDKILGGWDRNEELAVISARAGVGKSWILLKSITASVERGLRVGLFSGEMSINKVGYRFDTLMSHLSNGKIMHGNSDVAVDYKKFLDGLQSNHKGNLYVLTPDRINGDATVDVLRGFIEKYNLDILFIDQHSLLQDQRHAKQAFERASNISKDLKILQTLKHIPIISVSQQNRSSIEEGKFAGTENIAQSDRIAQDATVILFLSMKDGIMTMNIGKSRDGGTGRVLNYEVDFNTGKFEFLPGDEDADLFSAQFETSGTFTPQIEIASDALPFGGDVF